MQVVVALEFAQRVQQMSLVPDQHPIQQLAATSALWWSETRLGKIFVKTPDVTKASASLGYG